MTSLHVVDAREKYTTGTSESIAPYTLLDFQEVERKAHQFADLIESQFEKIADILLEYESFEVVRDETDRTLDLLRNIDENKKYFHLRVGAVTSFLPRNQPLYALTCFVLVPSFMSTEVHFRIPHGMKHFFAELLDVLDIHKIFPNVFVSPKQRLEFLTERSAVYVNPKTKDTFPVTDVVIFTGTSVHADQLRVVFDPRTLFISNGSGHNPLIISKDSNLSQAVEAVVSLQFYNQGQDCAAPNAILVHTAILDKFMHLLREEVSKVKVGQYRDRSCRIGPISDPKDLVRIQELLIDHQSWIDVATPGIIRSSDAIVEPTIICKPLTLGGNFSEIFAPIIFVQPYDHDSDLALYFEDPQYAKNAMNITVYGTSAYAQSIIDKPIHGKILHKRSTYIHNKHLHEYGLERGTQPYGGYGYGSSSTSLNGKIIPKPTLPQRDIFEFAMEYIIRKKITKKYQESIKLDMTLEYKNVQHLLRLQTSQIEQTYATHTTTVSDIAYIDVHAVDTTSKKRYLSLSPDNTYYLLLEPNVNHIATLLSEDINMLHELKKLLLNRSRFTLEEFRNAIYTIPKEENASSTENKKRQVKFFQHVYQLLFNKKSGPQLAPFLMDVDFDVIEKLLDVY